MPEVDQRLDIQTQIVRCLAEPLTVAQLGVRMAEDYGLLVTPTQLRAPLRALIYAGLITRCDTDPPTWQRVTVDRGAKSRRPTKKEGKKQTVWCCKRRRVWHATAHNNCPSGTFETLCGYTIDHRGAGDFERRSPECPHCVEELGHHEFF